LDKSIVRNQTSKLEFTKRKTDFFKKGFKGQCLWM